MGRVFVDGVYDGSGSENRRVGRTGVAAFFTKSVLGPRQTISFLCKLLTHSFEAAEEEHFLLRAVMFVMYYCIFIHVGL